MSSQNTFRPTIEFPWRKTPEITREELELTATGKTGRGMYFVVGIAFPLICIVTGAVRVLFLNDSRGVFPIFTGISVGGALMFNRYRERIAAYEELLKSSRDPGM